MVIEEGLLQVLWAICYNSNADSTFVEKYINLFYSDILTNLIVFNTDIEQICTRLENRNNNGGSELEHDIKNNKQAITKADDVKKMIILSVEKTNGKRIIEVN